jgi:glycosyltransferase involved in cell wall biosynthesis/organic radical activating enzyme
MSINYNSHLNETPPLISIIIPFFNITESHKNLTNLILRLGMVLSSFEILLIDDGSTDQSYDQLQSHTQDLNLPIKILSLDQNNGPGIARNLGVKASRGKFVMFLDSDDKLNTESLVELQNKLKQFEKEILYFDFTIEDKDGKPSSNIVRRDYQCFSNKQSLLKAYLGWRTFQECMFAVYKRDFLENHNISFESGYYEDILFGLKCATKVIDYAFLPLKVYQKVKTENSITSKLSIKHIEDYVQALIQVREFVSKSEQEIAAMENLAQVELLVDWNAAILSRIGVFCQSEIEIEDKQKLIRRYKQLLKSAGLWDLMQPPPKNRELTAYSEMYYSLIDLDFSDLQAVQRFLLKINNRLQRLWSCKDLEHSVFFAPNEIRTCCKRFFVEGKIKGDVVLNIAPIDVTSNVSQEEVKIVTEEQIRVAKRDLIRSINLGDENPCGGCPYLKLHTDWNSFDKHIQVEYISMEQHSICNLRCSYCDEKYYGGLLPDYDVLGSINSLLEVDALSDLRTVVWGGGEPTLDPNFSGLLSAMKNRSELCEHRFLSNGVRFSGEIADTLLNSSSMLVTSIDAGDEDTYRIVRGRKGLIKSLENLGKYLAIAPNAVIVKFIFTEGNKSISTVKNFVQLIKQYQLESAFFQISFDFKNEKIVESDLLLPLAMYSQLYEANCKLIFLDDLLITRLRSGLTRKVGTDLLLANNLSADCIAKPRNYIENKILLFGAGEQARIMNYKFGLLKNWPISAVVETGVWQDKDRNFFGKKVEDLSSYTTSKEWIILAGVQSIPKMFNEAIKLGIARDRIVRELLLA